MNFKICPGLNNQTTVGSFGEKSEKHVLNVLAKMVIGKWQ